MKLKYYIFLLILLLMYVSGCSKKAMVRKYYVLEPDSLITRQDLQITETLPYNIDIREFNIAKAFGQSRIAVRLESHKINYYYYHLWATHPSSAITYMIFRLVDGSKMFQKTSLGFSIDADFIITGNIHKLEIIEEKKDLLAHLNISFILLDNKKDEVLLRTTHNRKVTLKKKNINEFAAQTSTLLQQITSDYLIEVKNTLTSK
ncbi:MAG: ABC-type transport auxiliary lipoprotein family protein [bacterium]